MTTSKSRSSGGDGDCRSSEGMMMPKPHTTRPRPGRRRQRAHFLPTSTNFSPLFLIFSTLLLLALLITPTSAANADTDYINLHLARRAHIIFDPAPAPIPDPLLFKRAAASSSTSPSIAAPSDDSSDSSISGAAAATSGTTTGIESSSQPSSTALPKPFDGGLGTNFTQPSCPTFLRDMIANETFLSCVPVSLMLQNSISFFDASRHLTTITHALNASCSPSLQPSCSTLLSTYALTLRSPTGCSSDYERENPVVRQAYAGLLAYDTLRSATCLRNIPSPGTGQSDNTNYCYANAITNATSPTDGYVYFLPLGISLPASSLPTCNNCLQQTMAVFAGAAVNKSQPLSLDYIDAAHMVNLNCGPNFANASIPGLGSGGTGSSGRSAAARIRGESGGWITILFVVGVGLAML